MIQMNLILQGRDYTTSVMILITCRAGAKNGILQKESSAEAWEDPHSNPLTYI